MSFSSASSKKKATDTVNKLFESMLPGTRVLPGSNQISTTESFHREATKQKLLPEEIRKINKTQKSKQNKQVNKKVLKDKKFTKLMKYKLIKSHKDKDDLTEEEQKFLRKLIKKNSSAIRRAGDVDDMMIKEEIDELRSEILLLENEKYDRSNAKQKENRLQAFKEKIASGTVSYPGLTPGLAPVGLDDESDEE
ncbi:hypothetical protein PUMCH_004955 [Australozyma saopauloensis]|uniref:Regulator of rDNA transcription 14 n=1 Tax=Australozyma saopauloensis TaxID=291208 RepID=A0AAX4HH01_9ASCO|nr:hypothetical protein PUMCH_004955 [[Candida] saopauloensis]